MIKILLKQSSVSTTKKIVLFIAVMIFSSFSWCQSSTDNCIEHYEVNANRVSNENAQMDAIILSWDFTKTPNNQQLELSYEIQPLNACWLGLEGKIRSEIIFLKTDYNADNIKSHLEVLFKDLDSKCFKWKAVIINTETGCKIETKWQFASFL